MADDVMLLQRFLQWWQRNISVAYVLLGAVAVSLVGMLWYAYGPVTMAGMWGVVHGRTATYQGTPLKLPAGWREEEGVARSDFHLVRPYTWREKTETVDVDEFTGSDVDFERTMNTLRSLETMATKIGDVAAVYSLSEANAARYACVEHDAPDHTVLHVTCLTRDGRHVVRMLGDESSLPDFAAILTELARVK